VYESGDWGRYALCVGSSSSLYCARSSALTTGTSSSSIASSASAAPSSLQAFHQRPYSATRRDTRTELTRPTHPRHPRPRRSVCREEASRRVATIEWRGAQGAGRSRGRAGGGGAGRAARRSGEEERQGGVAVVVVDFTAVVERVEGPARAGAAGVDWAMALSTARGLAGHTSSTSCARSDLVNIQRSVSLLDELGR
jgi:hypothetical protein